ncbi:MAG: hypothetical protein II942_05255 [Alphaproteobacteria bacterium]|nr:hypothetical protein [Alphaproteobacteria bacterium]
MTNNVNESGRTMLEMLGVLAIMGVIMYGAIAGISFGVEMYQINAAYNQIEEISEGIVELYSWSRSYGGANDADEDLETLVCRNDITECYSSEKLRPALGGASLSVGRSSCGGNGCEQFVIIYGGLSYLACNRLRDSANGRQYRHVTCKVESSAGVAVGAAAYVEDECVEGNGNRLKCTSR